MPLWSDPGGGLDDSDQLRPPWTTVSVDLERDPARASLARDMHGRNQGRPRRMDLRILLVESDETTLTNLTTLLYPQGWLIVQARSVSEAAELYGQEGAGILLVGPDLDGMEPDAAVAALRAARTGDNTPALALVAKPLTTPIRARLQELCVEWVLPITTDAATLVACVRAILRNRSLSDDLRRRAQELEALRREQWMVVDALVHDLKNPLAVVLANVGWALDYLPPAETEVFEALQDAQEGVHRIQSTLEDLSMVTKLDKSEVPLRRESIRVSEMVQGVMTSRAPEARARNVSMTVAVDDRLEFNSDPIVLRRVIDGMVESSIRYAPSSGRIELSARAHGGLEISIVNTSVPPPASHDRILIGTSEGESVPSSGETVGAQGSNLALRLYFCRKAVEAFQGQLEVIESPEAKRSLIMRLPGVGT